jgi:hypothetical protein
MDADDRGKAAAREPEARPSVLTRAIRDRVRTAKHWLLSAEDGRHEAKSDPLNKLRAWLAALIVIFSILAAFARRAHKPDQASGREPVAAWRGVSKGFLT